VDRSHLRLVQVYARLSSFSKRQFPVANGRKETLFFLFSRYSGYLPWRRLTAIVSLRENRDIYLFRPDSLNGRFRKGQIGKTLPFDRKLEQNEKDLIQLYLTMKMKWSQW